MYKKIFVKSNILKIFSAVIISLALFFSIYQTNSYNLYELLNSYGFNSTEEKEAFESIIKSAGIIPDKDSLQSFYNKNQNKENFTNDLANLISNIQEKLIIRSGKQERWETKELEWMSSDQEEKIEKLKTLGFIEKIIPENKSPDAICILGAAKFRMQDRIDYAEFLTKNNFVTTKNIILLSGERYVTVNIDASEEELRKIAQEYNIEDFNNLTETHLIRHIYSKSDLSKIKDIGLTVIDTPRRELPRPTTHTTVRELMKWLEQNPQIRTILFVSNQPHVKYQQAIIEAIFAEDKNITVKYEVVGSAAQTNQIKAILEGMGSYIWAKTPFILKRENTKIDNSEAGTKLKKLYINNEFLHNLLNN